MGRAGSGKLWELTSNLFSLQGILDVRVETSRGQCGVKMGKLAWIFPFQVMIILSCTFLLEGSEDHWVYCLITWAHVWLQDALGQLFSLCMTQFCHQ